MHENPLVSIIVVTYNSAASVLETLESIADQSYRNIELIVSDDCSSDNTLKVCQNWIEGHKDRFVNTMTISVNENSGIPANCNRGIKRSKGEWIKLIAGDDLLDPYCIENLLSDSEYKNIIVGKFQEFYTDEKNDRIYGNILPKNDDLYFFSVTPEKQYSTLLTKAFNFAPAVIFRRKIFQKHGLFNEKYKLLEDLPYWLHITSRGEKIYGIQKTVVYYRVNTESVSMSSEKLFSIEFTKCFYRFKKDMVYPHISPLNLIYHQSELWDRIFFMTAVSLFSNKKNKSTYLLQYLFSITKLKIIINKIKKK